MRTIIKKDERGLIYKDGNYVSLLKPGKYFNGILMGKNVDILNVNHPFVTGKNLNLYLDDEELKRELDVVDVKDEEVALHFEDNHFAGTLLPGKYAFWNVLKKHRFVILDLRKPEVPEAVNATIKNIDNKIVNTYEIESYETGLLTFDGEYQRILKPGKYHFLNGYTKVGVEKVDMRQQQLDITGQEIMTRDKVTLRLNFVAQYKIADPVKAVLDIKNFQNQLYVLVQLILREYVGMYKLDELMEKKEEVGTFVLERLGKDAKEWGITFMYAGVKDIILPGEMKTILSKVIEAEKQAQANIITRREETASTRSLLNTAKLMEDNPVLLKLKELEYVEQISNKITNLSVIGGGEIVGQLGKLFGNLKGS
ncbi:MAG: slipin family protein [bacterium]|nr:slipin family protein [bacterium]